MTLAPDERDLLGRLAPFAEHPGRAVVILDFDGTLAPMVDDPPRAVPLPGTGEVLARLVRCVGRVAVVSGRPAAFLADVLPVDGLTIFGQYGVERLEGAAVVTDPRARAWADAVAAAAEEAQATLPDLFVERKDGIAATLHWRRAPHLEAQAVTLGRRLATTHGLRLEPGRLALELRPPMGIDKGSATRTLVVGAHAALVAGDDHGDLAAYAALSHVVAERRLAHGLRVAVRSAEAPAELLRQADHAVDGPAGLLTLLAVLADVLESP